MVGLRGGIAPLPLSGTGTVLYGLTGHICSPPRSQPCGKNPFSAQLLSWDQALAASCLMMSHCMAMRKGTKDMGTGQGTAGLGLGKYHPSRCLC